MLLIYAKFNITSLFTVTLPSREFRKNLHYQNHFNGSRVQANVVCTIRSAAFCTIFPQAKKVKVSVCGYCQKALLEEASLPPVVLRKFLIRLFIKENFALHCSDKSYMYVNTYVIFFIDTYIIPYPRRLILTAQNLSLSHFYCGKKCH